MNNIVSKAKAKCNMFFDQLEGFLIGAVMAIVMSGSGVFAATTGTGGGGGNIGLPVSVTKISIAKNIDATTMMGKLIGVIAAVFVVIGLFKAATSVFSILEAYSEDNTAAMNKSLKQLGIGIAFIAAPLLVGWLLK